MSYLHCKMSAHHDIFKDLKAELGNNPTIKLQKFQNWGKTQVKKDLFVTKPERIEQVQRVIIAAKKRNLKVDMPCMYHSRVCVQTVVLSVTI